MTVKGGTCTPLNMSDIDYKLARARGAPLVAGVVPSLADQPSLQHVSVNDSVTLGRAAAYLRLSSEYMSYWVIRHTVREAAAVAGHVFETHSESTSGQEMNPSAAPDVLIYDTSDSAGLPVGGRRFPFFKGTGFRMRFNKGRVRGNANKLATYNVEGICDIMDVVPERNCECCVSAPYAHGIMAPARAESEGRPPWDLSAQRSTLLTFCGGSWRGNKRGRSRAQTLARFNELSSSAEETAAAPTSTSHNTAYTKLFSAPLQIRHHHQERRLGWGKRGSFYRLPWEAYATTVFSWQPHGDTPTRRAFFDSWLMGCIPVIETRGAEMYSAMFRGILFDGRHRRIEDVAVVLDQATMYDADAVLRILREMPPEEVLCRQRKLRKLAPLLQWGHPDSKDGSVGYDAFDLVLASFVRD